MKKIIVAITLASLVLGLNSMAHSKKHLRKHYRNRGGIINQTGNVAGNVVKDTGTVVDDAAHGAGNILKSL